YAASETAIPSDCIAVAGSAGFADAAPSVQIFDRNYQPARAWRGNLSWGSTFKTLTYTIDATYSLNVNQPSTLDLNFSGVPRFTVASEGGRAVFVPPSSIVASTGALAASTARTSAKFGSVFSRTSDLRGWGRQISVRARPGPIGVVHGGLLLDG